MVPKVAVVKSGNLTFRDVLNPKNQSHIKFLAEVSFLCWSFYNHIMSRDSFAIMDKYSN